MQTPKLRPLLPTSHPPEYLDLAMSSHKSLRWRNLPITPTRSRFYGRSILQPLCFEEFAKQGGRGGAHRHRANLPHQSVLSLDWVFFVLPLALSLILAMSPAFAADRQATSPEAQTARYFDSISKDPNLLVAFLLEMPKGGDLHNHLSGAIYAETLIDWAKEQRACVDPKTFYLTPSLKLSTGDPYCPAPTRAGRECAGQSCSVPRHGGRLLDAQLGVSGQSGHDHFFDTFDKFGAATMATPGRCWPRPRRARPRSGKSTRS